MLFAFWIAFLAATFLLLVPLKRVETDGRDLFISNYLRTERVALKEVAGVDELPGINMSSVRIRFARKTTFGFRFMSTAGLGEIFSGRNRTIEDLRGLVATEKRSLRAER